MEVDTVGSQVQTTHPIGPSHGAAGPALALGPHDPELLPVRRVRHLGVGARAEVRVVLVEFLVAQVEQVALGILQRGVHIFVDGSVSLPKLLIEVWPSLTGELTVKDQDVSFLLIFYAVLWRCGERLGREEGGEELLVLPVLPVLRALDVPALELKPVTHVNYPGDTV